MKLTLPQRQMVEDGFPKELFRTDAQRRAWWDKHPPHAMPLFQLDKTRDEDEATAAFRAQEVERRRLKSLAGISRMKTRIASKAIDFSKMRWDARRAKFVEDVIMRKPEPLGLLSIKRGLAAVNHAVENMAQEPKLTRQQRGVQQKPVDPVWSRVNKDTARVLAELNGVWDAKYEKLSGGLLVMTVTNRLKGLVKKGGDVKWN